MSVENRVLKNTNKLLEYDLFVTCRKSVLKLCYYDSKSENKHKNISVWIWADTTLLHNGIQESEWGGMALLGSSDVCNIKL